MIQDTKPLVSVIMPAFNCEKFIRESIESIINQTYVNWELLICDDASSDATKSIIDAYAKKDSRIIISHNNTNQKLLKTRNRLIKLSKGSLITFQDADDYAHHKRIELLVNAFLCNPQLGLVSSQITFIKKNGDIIRTSNLPLSYEEIQNTIFKKNLIGNSSMMIRKDVLDTIGGGFRSYFDGLSYQDYDLSLLIFNRFQVRILSEALYFYRQHEKSASKKINIDRWLAKEIVIHLALQYKNRKSDDLMDGNRELVDKYFSNLKVEYLSDKSKI